MEPSVTSHGIKIIYFQLQPDCVHIEEMPQFTIKKCYQQRGIVIACDNTQIEFSIGSNYSTVLDVYGDDRE